MLKKGGLGDGESVPDHDPAHRVRDLDAPHHRQDAAGRRRVPRALGTCAANQVLRARRAGLCGRRGGLLHVHHAVGGGGSRHSGVNEGREATIFRLQLAKILKSQNVVPLLITFIEKIENADFWEILSGQDVIRRTHQLAVAVCRGERDALPSAHTSPDRGCTFSKVLSTVTQKYSLP